MSWYGMVDVCDGYLAAEASGSSFIPYTLDLIHVPCVSYGLNTLTQYPLLQALVCNGLN